MKLERAAFIKAIEQLKPALASSSSIPELKHVWVDKKYLYAFNNALGIRIDWPNELIPCGLPGAVLLGILQSSSAKEVELDQSGKTQCTFKMGRGSTTIPQMAIEHNPWPYPVKVLEGPVGLLPLMLTEEFIKGLKRVRVIKASNPSAVYHHGVVLFPSKATVALYTTDSKALAEVSVQAKLSKDLRRAILPFGFVTQLIALPVGSRVSFTQDSIIAEAPGLQVCSNLMNTSGVEDFPEFVRKALGAEIDPTPFPKEFREVLDRALVLAGSDLDKAFVLLSANKKELQLSGTLPAGQIQEKFQLASTAQQGSITVSLEHLKTLCKEAKEFMISSKQLFLLDGDDVLFIIAAHVEKK